MNKYLNRYADESGILEGKHVQSCAQWIDSGLRCSCDREITWERNRKPSVAVTEGPSDG